MPIFTNIVGAIRLLTDVAVNVGGVMHELDTVHANENGVLHEIFSAWKFPVLGDWHTTKSTAASNLKGDTYSVSVNGSAAADFTLTGRTKVTINITHYSSTGTTYTNVAEIRSGKFSNSYYSFPTDGAFAQRAQTGRDTYTTTTNLTAEYTLEKGNYYVGCGSIYNSGLNGTIEFDLKFEKA